MRQHSLPDGVEKLRKNTRKGPFFEDMNRLLPWKKLFDVIKPFYPKPIPDETTVCQFCHLMERYTGRLCSIILIDQSVLRNKRLRMGDK